MHERQNRFCHTQLRRSRLRGVWILVSCLAVALTMGDGRRAHAGGAQPPNIILILADDVGREVLECYGGTSYHTPHLSEFASRGALFEHFYVMPVCHPTRVSLLTGQYPRHVGNPAWGSFPTQAEERTFAQLARKAGYATAVAGKWQLCLIGDDLEHPGRLGFEEWSVFGWHEGPRYHEPMIYENGRLRTDTAGTYGPDLYLDFLVQFMERCQTAEKPFLAFYSMALCHDVTDDLAAPVPYGTRGRYDNYAEMVAQMDLQVGRLMEHVTSSGFAENTVVIFVADNGTPVKSKVSAKDQQNRFVYEQIVSRYRGDEVPGGKGKLTDWGTRVPALVVWQGTIPPGKRFTDLVDVSDILPTLVDLSEGELPAAATLDGRSFAGLLRGQGGSPRQWVSAELRGRYFAKTHNMKLYNDGKIFDTEVDPFEERPLDASALPKSRAAEVALLSRAIEQLR